MAVAANYLDESGAQLRQKLRSGRSLAEIANATSGKSSAGLIDALVQSRAAAIARGRTVPGFQRAKPRHASPRCARRLPQGSRVSG